MPFFDLRGVPAKFAAMLPISDQIKSIKHRFMQVNGIKMHIAEQGEGPLIVLAHGWPELWYSWRHVLPSEVNQLMVDFLISVDGKGAAQ